MIKLGTENFGLLDFDKVRLGSELVYQKGNFAPQSTTLLMHLDGNLINEVDGVTQSGTYEQIQGKFLYGVISRSTSNITKILYSYGIIGTDCNSGNKSATLSYWRKIYKLIKWCKQFTTN